MPNISLFNGTNYVEVPYIKVRIGNYTFGVGERTDGYDTQAVYNKAGITFPNYITELAITKINGQVNQYTLKLVYTITETSDPNFIEKVLSSVSKSRDIEFTYGDMAQPTYLYRDEKAILLSPKRDIDIENNTITYTISAVSSGTLAKVGSYSFDAQKNVQPSKIIEELLDIESYGLLDLFPGMRDKTIRGKMIPHTDCYVDLEFKDNISIWDYICYLVNSMKPTGFSGSDVKKNKLYIVTVHDNTVSTSGSVEYEGTYFKIEEVDSSIESSDAYEVDIGYPSQNAIMRLSFEDDEGYSIYYDYQENLNNEKYVQRISRDGELITEFAPVISSGNDEYRTREEDRSWWSKVTSYPQKAKIEIKGLLRPAILMQKVRMNVYFFGRKYLLSGLYMVTKQEDKVNSNGFKTTLDLLRISGDKE